MRTADGKTVEGDFLSKTLMLDGVAVECGVKGWIAPANNQIKDQLADFLSYCLEPAPGIPPPLLSPAEIIETISIIEHVKGTRRHVQDRCHA
jgi:hypothetical protein